MRLALSLVGRELRLSLRQGADSAAALLFFGVVITLFPLALGPEPAALARLAPSIIWVAALLAALLPLERAFGADLEDGALDLLLLSGLTARVIAVGKAVAHWLVTGLPLLIVSVPMALMLGLSPALLPPLLAGLLLGTLTLSLLGTTIAAMVAGAPRAVVLLPVLVLPLATPVVIFGATAAASLGAQCRQALLLEGAFLSFCAVVCPLAAGAALRGAGE